MEILLLVSISLIAGLLEERDILGFFGENAARLLLAQMLPGFLIGAKLGFGLVGLRWGPISLQALRMNAGIRRTRLLILRLFVRGDAGLIGPGRRPRRLVLRDGYRRRGCVGFAGGL